jgi:uncharacterized membrane protein
VARASFVLVGALPFLLTWARAHLPLGWVGAFVDAPFALVCHRMPERTLALWGLAMPVCSRCAGIFAGLALGAAVAWPRWSMARARLPLAGAAALMVADVVTQDAGLHPVWHATRLATGFLFGYLAAATIATAIESSRRPMSS